MSTTPVPCVKALTVGALSLLAGCAGNPFMNMDPWPGSMKEQQNDAWLTGGRYSGGAIVASDTPVDLESGASPSSTTDPTAANTTPALGGLDAPNPSQEPLLTWDGDVIDGPERGSVVERENPTHGIEPTPGGRTYLLQLYQDVLDERDQLEEEVRALRKSIGEAQARIDDTSADATGLTARMDSMEAEVKQLRAENEDLAARLATTQIRRLEAEKMLLEARIDWYRMQDGAVPEELVAEPMSGEMKSMATGPGPGENQ